MKTDTKVCIGVTIAIVAALLIAAIVFNIDIGGGLAAVGFLFLIALPTYIWSRRRDEQKRNSIDNDLQMQFLRRKGVLEEIEEYLDESIEKFKEWGRNIKELEKSDEEEYYGTIALIREEGMDFQGASYEYGQDVSCLIEIRRKLRDIE